MENVVDLNEYRLASNPPAEVVSESELAARLQSIVREYVDAVYESVPMAVIENYAKESIEREIRSIPFEIAIKIIEQEFPEIACKLKDNLA